MSASAFDHLAAEVLILRRALQDADPSAVERVDALRALKLGASAPLHQDAPGVIDPGETRVVGWGTQTACLITHITIDAPGGFDAELVRDYDSLRHGDAGGLHGQEVLLPLDARQIAELRLTNTTTAPRDPGVISWNGHVLSR